MFNDDNADMYSINRYFGLYVNAIDLASFNLSDSGLQQFSVSVNQTPFPRKGIDGSKISMKSFVQSNDTGIRIYADASTVERIPTLDPVNIFTSIPISGATGSFSFNAPPSALGIVLYYSGDWTYKMFKNDIFLFNDTLGNTASATLFSVTYNDDVTTAIFPYSTLSSIVPISTFISNITNWVSNFYTETKYENYRDSIFNSNFIVNQPRFMYVKDKNNDLYNVQNSRVLSVPTGTFTTQKIIELNLQTTSTDIANFTGFSQLLTQTPAVILDSIGKAVMQIDLTDYFESNDYLEIRWTPLTTSSSGYPLRWRIVANASILNPGESWPSYTINSDSAGQYYMTYFSPGDSSVNLNTVAHSIQEAFRRFPFMDFEILAKNNTIYFKSTQSGVISESAQLDYSLSTANITVLGNTTSPTSGIINFVGGSDRKRVRAAIDQDVAQGMLPTEYISTKGSYSLIEQYLIFDQYIGNLPYVDEPVYDNAGNLIDFNNSDVYSTIVLANENQEIQTTYDGKITSYNLFTPTYGILSVLPFRDFDMDFYQSDYTKSYLPELIKYFGRYTNPVTVTSITGTTAPVYTFSTGLTFSSYPASVPYLSLSLDGSTSPLLHLQDSQFLFSSAGSTATLIYATGATFPSIGNNILFMPDEKGLYFTEDNLSKFKGFMSLSSIVSSSDETRFKLLENLWDPQRFLTQWLNSEYDRLSENYLKSLVLKSRVVPYITKWISSQGKDIRDNDYRFNYHRSFGNMNFSPSSELSTSDPRYHTHEWTYLDSVPTDFPIGTFPDYTFSYFYEPISDKYDFKSMSKDWFSEYFSTGYPTERYLDATGNFSQIEIDIAERYSYFNYETFSGQTFTLFRGQRIQISELDPVSGNIVTNSTKYDNYRFSVIIQSEETDSTSNDDPVSMNTIVNENFKFIVIIVTVKTKSYRFPLGKLGYSDIYTLQNCNDKSTFTYNPSLSSLSSFTIATPSDVKFSKPINIENFGDLVNYYNFYNTNSSFVSNFLDEINPLDTTGVFSDIVAFYTTTGLQISSSFNLVQDVLENSVEFNSNNIFLKYSSIPIIISVSIPYTIVSWRDFTFYYESGGHNSLSGIKDRLSFYEISRVIEGTSEQQSMNYQIYSSDGTVSVDSNFQMKMISPEKLQIVFDYAPTTDDDKPPELLTYPVIGSTLTLTKDIQTIYRYQGDYQPKFRDVLKFWLREDEEFTSIASQDFLLNNTHLGIELNNFSILKNQFYNKVADNEILRISQNSAYTSVYPLVDEISIDKQDVFAWSSSWDQNYYRKYSDVADYTVLRGTEEMTEIKSLFGSKAMKVPDTLTLDQFEVTQIGSSAGVNLRTYINNELTYQETPTSIKIQVNVYERLLREFLGNTGSTADLRARKDFYDTMNNIPGSFDVATIDSRVQDYLSSNILNFYEIENVTLYILQTGNPGVPIRLPIEYTTIDNVNYTLSKNVLVSKKYLSRSDVKITTIQDLIFELDVPLDSRYYVSVSISVDIKRI